MIIMLNSLINNKATNPITCGALALSVIAGAGIAAAPAEAASITYQGTLKDGIPEFDAVSSSGFSNDQSTSRFFNFFGNQGDVVTIEALRIEQDLDPALWVFEGIFQDTSDFASGFSLDIDEDDPGFLEFADDEIPNPGPFADPRAVVTLSLPGTGEYTAIVTNFASGPNDGGDGAFDFQITCFGCTTPVPEPASVLGLLITGSLGFGSALKRKLK
ncbi:PEP-CTERM sorting domain-containing protein [Moorena producens]|uniref:PEP-CTERM sorting domain-containing protein n=1 Tax=Moorena producens TaxID=1155739 RepID=UPI003C764877